jgi:predicted acylesterase/phospholipase RssA/CRP-like cAMP-binding protein
VDRDELKETLAASPVFAHVGGPLLEHLLGAFQPAAFAAGDHMMRQGEEGEALYVVLSGTFEVYLPDVERVVVHRGGPRDVVGELGLLTRERRSASVVATSALRAARLPRAVFEGLDDRFPDAFQSILLAILDRLRHSHLERILRSPELFGDVSESALAAISARMEWVSLRSGDQLLAQGEPGDALYILLHGRLSASIAEPDGSRRRLAEVRRGELVGEISLLTGRPRGADVHAIRDSELARLSRDAFDRLVQQEPAFVVRNLTGSVVADLADKLAKPRAHHRRLSALAILPLHEGVDLEGFCRRLEVAFDRMGSSLWLDRRRVDEVFGPPSIIDEWPGDRGREILAGWLNEREARNDQLLLQGEYGLTPWTEVCIRQADQILWVADADALVRDRAFHAGAARLASRTEKLPETLALLQPGSGAVSGTARWLDKGDWARHHHVRPGNQEDVDRIARFLTDRAVGLVLSGGAARGFAHAGVVRAMREAGVPIDCVGGVSMGAIMAALCAMECGPDEMIERTLWLTHRVMDRTFPMVSVMRGRRFIDRLREWLEDRRIEDLPLPSFYLSANLTQARVEEHDRGLLRAAINASNAPPGLGPPVVHRGDLLVDGFVMNNLPVDRMRRFVHGGPIVAVDVMPAQDLPDNADYGERGLSGLKVLYRKLNPFVPSMTIPTIAEIIMRSHEINSVARQRRLKGETPFYLQPPIAGFDMFDYAVGPKVADAAYAAALVDLRRWAPELLSGGRGHHPRGIEDQTFQA